jgi:hypothetical protein
VTPADEREHEVRCLWVEWDVADLVDHEQLLRAGNRAALILFSPPMALAHVHLCCEQGLQKLLVAPGLLPSPLSQAGKRSGGCGRLQRPEEVSQLRCWTARGCNVLGLEYTLFEWLRENVLNVHPIGRNGMFRYDNQDHSMHTAMLTVKTVVTGASHDVWSVNVEREYHEQVQDTSLSASSGTGRDAPEIARSVFDESVAALRSVDSRDRRRTPAPVTSCVSCVCVLGGVWFCSR